MAVSFLDGPLIRMEVPQPFQLSSSLESGQAHRWRREPSQDGEVRDWYCSVIRGTVVKVRAGQEDCGHDTCVLELTAAPRCEHAHVEELLGSYFRLGDDITAIHQDICRDPRVSDMADRYRGLRLLRQEPWETCIAFICSANSNIPRIHANMEAMARSFGDPVPLGRELGYTFPSPERLAAAGEASLRALGLGFRARYVDQASRLVARGKLDLESLRSMAYDEAKGTLMEVPGIGPKVADCILLHSLDQLEAFPIDVWVRRALSDWYFPGEKPPPDRIMVEWAREHFGPYAGYAQLYLFHGRRVGVGRRAATQEADPA